MLSGETLCLNPDDFLQQVEQASEVQVYVAWSHDNGSYVLISKKEARYLAEQACRKGDKLHCHFEVWKHAKVLFVA